MLYLIKHTTRFPSNYFFVNTSTSVASPVWSSSVQRAVDDFTIRAHRNHTVFSWIASGCLKHDYYLLVATFESDDLTQDFEAGIANFRENHPEYFL